MNNLHNKIAASIVLLFGSLFMTGSAGAQSGAEQVLDTITITGDDFAIELNSTRPPNFDPLIPPDLVNDSLRDFVDCESSTANGLTCIDRDNIRNWPNPNNPANSSVLFSCGNGALPLNNRKGNACTAIARDTLAANFIGGRQNGTANIVIKVVVDTNGAATGGCPDPTDAYTSFMDGANYFCWAELETGRPRIQDIDVIEGSLAAGFSGGVKELLVLEEKKTVLVYSNFDADPRNTKVREIASGKREFNLNGNEKILHSTLMEHVRPGDALERAGLSDFFVIVATDRGRLIAVNTTGTPSGDEVFDLTSVRPSTTSCPAGEESFDVAAGPDGNLVYATDRNYCLLHVFDKKVDGDGNFDGFNLVTSLSTATDDEETELFPPLTISVSPGIGFDLLDEGCDDEVVGCTFISGDDGADAATLQSVSVVSEESGVTVYQATGIPFCSYKPVACFKLLDTNFDPLIDPLPTREEAIAILEDMDVLFRLPGAMMTSPVRPEEYAFNVTKLLPQEILDRFTGFGTLPGEIPPLWMLPDYRAQLQHDFFFEALFFVSEARTDGVLTLILNVAELQGSADLGCQTAGDLLPNYTLADLLSWDVTTRVSERDPTFDGPQGQSPANKNFQGTLVNAGCGTTRSRSKGISMFPYNLEMSGCPGTLDGGGILIFDTEGGPTCVLGDLESAPGSYTGGSPITEIPDDAVFAKSYVTLYDELFTHLDQLVCEESSLNADDAILSQFDCGLLAANWFNGKDKLVKALDATIQPKNSAGAQNFGAVQSQLANYRTILNAANTMDRPDPVNEVGGQSARLDTLETVMNDKLIPSIPVNGFVESNTVWAE